MKIIESELLKDGLIEAAKIGKVGFDTWDRGEWKGCT